MMKKYIKSGISILLCAVMIFGAAPLEGLKEINLSGALKKIAGWFGSFSLSTSASALAATGKCGDNVYWNFDEETGTLTISGEGEMKIYIDDFINHSEIRNVIINNGVTNIDSGFE